MSQQELPAAPVYREPIRATKVQVYDPPGLGFSSQDLVELGAIQASAGFTAMQSRALQAKIQQAAAQTATAVMPDLLEEVRKIQAGRLMEVIARVRAQSSPLGFIRVDRVVQILQDVMTRVPQQ